MFDHTINIKDCLAAEGLLVLHAQATAGNSQSPPSDTNTFPVRPEAQRPNARNALVPQSSGDMPPPSLNFTGSMAVNDNSTLSITQVYTPLMSQVRSRNQPNRQQLHRHQQCNCSRCISEESPRLNDLFYPSPADRRLVNLPSLSQVLPQHFTWHHHSRRPSRTWNTSQPVVPSQRQSRAAETQPYPQRQQQEQQQQQQQHQHHHVSLEAIKQYHTRKMKPQLKDKKKAKERMSSSSPSQENNTSSDDAELDAFFSSLRQHYRNEFEKELKEQANSSDSSDSTETDESDDGSLYRPSSSEYVSNNNKSMKKNKKSAVDTKKNNHTEKPRWTLEEKAELFEAVVRHKSLDIMATFDWAAIGADIGRLDKACKDQWRRGILKMFRDSIHKLDNV